MTREERIKRVEELEKELKLLENKELAKHNIYYDKKCNSIEKKRKKE